jgi:hypothetical protein
MSTAVATQDNNNNTPATRPCAGYLNDKKSTGTRCPNLLPATSRNEFCGNHPGANKQHRHYHVSCDKLQRCTKFNPRSREVRNQTVTMLEKTKTEYQSKKHEAHVCGDEREAYMTERVFPEARTQ